jgi:hypothetical protein
MYLLVGHFVKRTRVGGFAGGVSTLERY